MLGKAKTIAYMIKPSPEEGAGFAPPRMRQ